MPIAPTQLSYLCDLVYRKSAIVLTAEKEYLVESRLAPIARAAGFDSVEALIISLRSPAGLSLQAVVVEAMTTNETSFFRDLHPFDALRQELLPKLKLARASTRSLVIMSAACSTGQEAYSLAMLLQEPALDMASWKIRILGFDLSEAVLSRARSGLYTQGEVNRGLPAPMLVKHFDRVGSDWQIKKALRDQLEVRQMNLIEPWPTMARARRIPPPRRGRDHAEPRRALRSRAGRQVDGLSGDRVGQMMARSTVRTAGATEARAPPLVFAQRRRVRPWPCTLSGREIFASAGQ